jgi:MFS transporter, OPA family, glycerol-3-phosphate transporter
MKSIFRWFAPPPAAPLRSAADVDRLYPLYRWRVFEAAFLAYAGFYVVRNNFAPVAKEIGEALSYDKLMIGNILAATAIAYGIGKFIMGYFADRSDARKYVAVGMLLTAACNFAFGSSTQYTTHLLLWTLNGFIQGMGYGPCCRGLSHWYSHKERGTVFGFWNISHNLGGGIAGVVAAKSAEHFGWASAFYIPGCIATVLAIYLFFRMRDTPQSLGLPPVEVYRNDYPPGETEDHERELPLREMMFKYILPNRNLWILAIANIFVYIARYSMLDWGPTYLKEVKGATLGQGGFSTLVIEFSGAAGMLTMGWLSDKIGGSRARVSVIAMIPVPFAFFALRYTTADMFVIDMILFSIIGFLVYTPVMFSGVMSLDFTSKKAVGTAAGFVGFFGYVGRVIQGKGMGWIAHDYGWDAAMMFAIVCCVIAIGLLALLWNAKAEG